MHVRKHMQQNFKCMLSYLHMHVILRTYTCMQQNFKCSNTRR